jgi:acyl phosphate:glycerol-3-phosphate acyltransferase
MIDSTAAAVVVTAVAGYLLGSVPVAVLVGRSRGIDLRSVGDRNPG